MVGSRKSMIDSASGWTNQAVHALNQALDCLERAGGRGTLADYGEDCRDRLATFATAVRNRAQETRHLHRSPR